MAYEKFRSRSKQRDDYDDDRSDNRRARNPKKKSGCSKGETVSKSTGEIIAWIRGWNASKSRGLISFVATLAKTGKTWGTSSKGRDWVRLVCKITSSREVKPILMTGFWYADTQQLIIKDLQMVASVKKNYFGRYYKPKN